MANIEGSSSQKQGWNQSDAASASAGASNAWNAGQNTAWNNASNVTGSQSTSGQDVWGGNLPGLQQLYGTAQQLISGGGLAQQAGATGQAGRDAWMSALQPGQNPYFQQNAQAALDQSNRNFQRSIMPALDDRGVSAGAYGGSRDQLARGEAAGLQAQGNADMLGRLYGSQYQSDLASRDAALGMTGGMQGTSFAGLNQAAGLLGGPLALGSSSSSSFGQGASAGGSQGTTAGASNAWNQAISQARARGGESGSSDSFGMGVLSK